MKENILEYKGYHAKIEFNVETYTLRGKIDGIKDLVTFQSSDAKMIEIEFHNAVEDYLEFCKEVGKEPEKEYRGSFNVRIAPDLHRRLATVAYKNGETLNALVEKAIKSYIDGENKSNIKLQQTIKILAKTIEAQSIYHKNQQPKIDIGDIGIPFNGMNINMAYQMERMN